MRLPERVLRQVRGPMLAAAVAGCSTTPAATGRPEPAPEPEVTEPATTAAPDPVAYDADAEAERLARLDRALAADEHRRDERIGEERREGLRRLRARRQRRVIVLDALCGRG